MQSFKLLARKSTAPYPSFYDYENQLIGAGSFGKVYRSTDKKSLKSCAIKAISKYDPHGNPKEAFLLDQVNHELQIMYQLDSEYIIKVLDHFQDQNNVYIVLQYADGVELYRGIIQKRRRLQNQQIAKVIYQLCLALQHLHQKKIIHRDIKPQNIILTKSKDIKLIDFGTSNYVGPEEIRMTRTGSIPYFAPEIVTKVKHGEAVDVWCVGILLYEMYVLKTPFEELEKTEINIITNKVVYPPGMQPDMKDLIEKILVKDPKKRLKIHEIINHPWIVKYVFGNIPHLAFKTTSKSVQKQPSSRRMSPKSLTHKSISKSRSKQKQKQHASKPKSITKSKSNKSLSKPKTMNDLLRQKISKLKVQIREANEVLKKQEEKQKSVLNKKISDLQTKLHKYSRESSKYQSIIKINTKKIREINQQINQFYILKHQNDVIQSSIQMKKQQEAIELENRKSLRLQLANLETKLKLNKSSRKSSSHRFSPSPNRSKSSNKPILSNRSANNVNYVNSSLEKYLSTKSEKMTTEGSMRETNIAEIEGYINNLMIKHNLATN